MIQIKEISAREVLDSRGNPTVEATVLLSDGSIGTALVPSGASTGKNEAHELRDKDGSRYFGKGVLKAVSNVNDVISPALIGMSAYENEEADSVMIALDGMYNKSCLGANAILSVSLALARAGASSKHMPLYRYLGGALPKRMPVPMMNILNGGVHADNDLDIQEYMILPVGAQSFAAAVRMGVEIYHSLKNLLHTRGLSVSIGDEGGFAPNLGSDESALSALCDAIDAAGYKPGRDVMLGLDLAASEWYDGEVYRLPKQGISLSSDELISKISSLVEKYPILSLEDPMSEDDMRGWRRISEAFSSKKTILVGDDLFVTDAKRVVDGAKQGIASAVLIKPNQIGTLTETAETVGVANLYGYKSAMSHRSGETEDDFIADLAVALETHFIKCGAPARGERTSKYNRLMKIEEELFSSQYGF